MFSRPSGVIRGEFSNSSEGSSDDVRASRLGTDGPAASLCVGNILVPQRASVAITGGVGCGSTSGVSSTWDAGGGGGAMPTVGGAGGGTTGATPSGMIVFAGLAPGGGGHCLI